MERTPTTRPSDREDRPCRPWIRSEPIRAMFLPQELEDIRFLAESWNVPIATVVWVIVHERLMQWKKRAPELGPNGLAIMGALTVLRQRLEKDSSGAAPDEPISEL